MGHARLPHRGPGEAVCRLGGHEQSQAPASCVPAEDSGGCRGGCGGLGQSRSCQGLVLGSSPPQAGNVRPRGEEAAAAGAWAQQVGSAGGRSPPMRAGCGRAAQSSPLVWAQSWPKLGAALPFSGPALPFPQQPAAFQPQFPLVTSQKASPSGKACCEGTRFPSGQIVPAAWPGTRPAWTLLCPS